MMIGIIKPDCFLLFSQIRLRCSPLINAGLMWIENRIAKVSRGAIAILCDLASSYTLESSVYAYKSNKKIVMFTPQRYQLMVQFFEFEIFNGFRENILEKRLRSMPEFMKCLKKMNPHLGKCF